MSLNALETLTGHATAFARCYVAVCEAMIREGVTEDQARYEARMTALMCSVEWDDVDESEGWDVTS